MFLRMPKTQLTVRLLKQLCDGGLKPDMFDKPQIRQLVKNPNFVPSVVELENKALT